MFIRAGSNVRIFCDTGMRAIRVQVNAAAALPQCKELWSEVAHFTEEKRWYRSAYSRHIDLGHIQEMVEWFWHDMSQT